MVFPESDNVTRRRFVAIGATAAVSCSTVANSVFAAPAKMTTLAIDAHSHIWTREVDKFPLATGQTLQDLAPASFTAEELLKLVRPFDVSRVVLIQHHIYHGWDNSYLIDAARRYPQQFRVVGMVDDRQKNPAALMRKMLPQRVTGIRITPRIHGKEKWLDSPGMAAMWKCAADNGQAMCCLIDAGDLPAVDAMCRRHPDTPVVIDHFARIGVDGEIRDVDVKQLCRMARHKHTHVKLSAYYALGKKKPPYRDLIPLVKRVIDAFGVERCMWASDAPYQVVDGHNYEASINLIRKEIDGLSDGDREHLLQKTAARVYGFDA